MHFPTNRLSMLDETENFEDEQQIGEALREYVQAELCSLYFGGFTDDPERRLFLK